MSCSAYSSGTSSWIHGEEVRRNAYDAACGKTPPCLAFGEHEHDDD